MVLFFRVYVGQWLTQVILYSVLDSEYRLICFKTWICWLNIYFLFCDGVCSTTPNILPMFLFNSFCLGNINKTLIENFKRALRDVTTEEGYYVLGSFCQNVKVVSWCLYFTLLAKNGLSIFKYKRHIMETRLLLGTWFYEFISPSFMDSE